MLLILSGTISLRCKYRAVLTVMKIIIARIINGIATIPSPSSLQPLTDNNTEHDDVIKWKHFPCYWPFVQRIHQLPLNSPHKRQWHGALMFSLICAWLNCWANNRDASDLRHHPAYCDVTVMPHLVTTTSWRRSKKTSKLRVTGLCKMKFTNDQ